MQEKVRTRSQKRESLRSSLKIAAAEAKKELEQYTRQVDYDTLFDAFDREAFGGSSVLLKPPYLPGKMYELSEQSSMLSACVRAYVDNIDGYGYDISSAVADDDDIQSEDNPSVRELKDFFDEPNDTESFISIREKLRRDLEITGNAYLEVVRSREGKPALLFWVDAKRVRVSATRESTLQDVTVTRAGQEITVPVEKRFRSYCMLSSEGAATGPRARYFKQYGDQRTMNAETGEFEDSPAIHASEIIHFKIGNDVYGIPRWIGAMLSVLGSWKSSVVNYDLFDNQGIPPMIISVTGGMLTDESYEDLVNLFRKAKGYRNFSKLLVLEAEGTGGSIDGKENTPGLNIKNMSEYRAEDAMFLKYLEYCQKDIQVNGFRLPGLFLGSSDDANYAIAFIVRKSAEEQLFVPERRRFDEVINKTIVKDFGYKDLTFRSNAPVLQSTEDFSGLLNTLVNAGVFTTNGLISFVNAHMGTNIALYENEAWADEPISKQSIPTGWNVVDASTEEEIENAGDEAVEESERREKALEELSNVLKSYAEGGCSHVSSC